MPRVSEAHRQARRDEIAAAALRVLERRGVAETSIAQIVEECGLSAGAIYGNFENKAGLARYVAQRALAWRVEALEEAARQGAVQAPADVVRVLLGLLESDPPPLSVVLQFWGEATVDPELHEVILGNLDTLRRACEQVLRPWADRQPDGGAGLAARTAQGVIVVCQGFLVNRGLAGWLGVDDYVAILTRALGPPAPS